MWFSWELHDLHNTSRHPSQPTDTTTATDSEEIDTDLQHSHLDSEYMDIDEHTDYPRATNQHGRLTATISVSDLRKRLRFLVLSMVCGLACLF